MNAASPPLASHRGGRTIRQHRHGSVRRLVTCLLAIIGLVALAGSPAAAQDDVGTLKGTLTYKDADGEAIPVEGVVISVADASGAEVAQAASAADGTLNIEVPAPADYTVSIDAGTIPDGLSLRNPDKTSLPTFTLSAGQERNLLFPIVEGDDGAVTTTSTGSGFGTRAARLAIDGLIFGLVIAMCSIGLSLIFGTTGLTNFAHGELVTFGALIALWLNSAGVHVLLAAPIAVAATALLGGANEHFLWRPLRNRGTGLIAMLVVSIGLSIVARYVYLYLNGGDTDFLKQYSLQAPYEFGPLTIVPRQLWIIAISATTLLVVAIGVQTTKLGKAMRAVADNRDLAESSGIDVQKVIRSIWIIGGGLAGLGGVLFGLNQGVAWDMGFELLLLMFAAVTLGGLGTAYGPLLGAIIVGLFVNLSTLFIAPELKNVGALLVLVVILLVRPQGVLGRKERIG